MLDIYLGILPPADIFIDGSIWDNYLQKGGFSVAGIYVDDQREDTVGILEASETISMGMS